jgi:hypothetical protein
MHFGWLPDYPDNRDYTRDTNEVNSILKSGAESAGKVDLRSFAPPYAVRVTIQITFKTSPNFLISESAPLSFLDEP